jgi:hypothetical protein
MQEWGRGGRDGKDSWCTAFYHEKAYSIQMFFINCKYPPREAVECVYAYLKKVANKDGVCKMTLESIGEHCGKYKDSSASAVSILAKFKVLERSNDSDSLTSVKFLKPHLLDKYAQYVPEIEKIGFKNEQGFFEFNPINLADALGIKTRKLNDTLKELDKNGYIQWVAPYRGKTTKIVGDIKLVDFDYLKRRRESYVDKLNTVFEFCKVPDDRKHDFIADYFRGEEGAVREYRSQV